MNYCYEISDGDYKSAVNYDGTNYYNSPITITVQDNKYILPFGTHDDRWTKTENNLLYIVGENSGLSYASLVIIDVSDSSIVSAYGDNLEDSFFSLELEQQISYLSEYLPY